MVADVEHETPAAVLAVTARAALAVAALIAMQSTAVPSTTPRKLLIRVILLGGCTCACLTARPGREHNAFPVHAHRTGGEGRASAAGTMLRAALRDPAGERLLEGYGHRIGLAPAELETPALLLDLAVARRNIDRMAHEIRNLGAALRPHVKAHKSPHLARLQMEAGAVGVACATVWEAVVMAEQAGIEDILIANQVVGHAKIARVAALAAGSRVTVAVDDERNVRDLSRAALAAGSIVELLIEVDIGMRRAGVRSAEQAVALAATIGEH